MARICDKCGMTWQEAETNDALNECPYSDYGHNFVRQSAP